MQVVVTKTTSITLTRDEIAKVLATHMSKDVSFTVKPSDLSFKCDWHDRGYWDLSEVSCHKIDKL